MLRLVVIGSKEGAVFGTTFDEVQSGGWMNVIAFQIVTSAIITMHSPDFQISTKIHYNKRHNHSVHLTPTQT